MKYVMVRDISFGQRKTICFENNGLHNQPASVNEPDSSKIVSPGPLGCRGAAGDAGGLPLLARADSIPRPEGIQSDVNFWIRVYTEVTTNEGFLHDERNLGGGLRHDEVRRRQLVARTAAHGRRASRPAHRRAAAHHRGAADGSGARGAVGGRQATARACGVRTRASIILKDATTRIRFQLGQADRFKEGLIRSSSWEAHIAETFANQGLPSELAVLPHVESSFNAAAYSKVGAAGLWQFMRSTGRRYMRVDDAVDERLDPYRSTEAAAQLLAYNYRVLGSWPLALTAYNHGAAGMRRAKESVGTDDYVKINRTYTSRTFGFASRNFFPSFLAALTIDENPEKYFGALERRPEQKFREVTMPAYVRLATLERTLDVDREQLRVLNPAWRPTIYNGTRLVPRGYRLRLPADTAEKWTPELLAARLPANELYAGQVTPRTHRVRKGETMAAIAQRYGMTAARLGEMNGLSANASCAPAGDLQLARAAAAHAVRRGAGRHGCRGRNRGAVAGERDCGKRARGRVLRRSSWRFARGALRRVSACRRPSCSR